MNNTSLTRLKRENDLMKKKPNEYFNAYPIQDDLFTWHFTIRGMENTEFEGGFYHGVIKLPNSYPLKPPNLMFLNPNGRFDINMDVCLSVTKFHSEEWQASWTIATILEALIAFFPIRENHDAIGAIDYPIEVRKKYALNSKKWKCDMCGLICNTLPQKEPKTIQSQSANEQIDKDRKESQTSENEKKNQTITPNNNINSNVEGTKFNQSSGIDSNENMIEQKITTLEKKPSITNENSSLPNVDELNSNIAINNESQNNKSEKDDNNSDLSSLVNQKIDAQEIKMVKKSKMKKGDFDRKSHLSHNIEGVIFEDINEDEEYEEKKLDPDYTKNLEEINDRDSMNIKKDILKKIQNSKFNENENALNQNEINKLNQSNNLQNIKYNDINNILKRNHSTDPNAKPSTSETGKTNIMQELLRFRNINFGDHEANIVGDEQKDENKITTNKTPGSLKHHNSTPLIPSNFKEEDKEKFISFEKVEIEEDDLNQENNDKEKNTIGEKLINGTYNAGLDSEPSKNLEYIINKLKKEREREIIIKEVKEKIAKMNDDEAEFYEIAKTIKSHKSSNKDEIINEIIESNIKKYMQKGDLLESLFTTNALKNEISKKKKKAENLDSAKASNGLTNIYKQFDKELKGVIDVMEIIKDSNKSEKIKNFINCKNSALNLLTKSRYNENKEFRLRILNVAAIILILIVFLIYHFYLKNLLN